ncbi:MAG: tetratricopeptide repeat protein, partial [Planctomycetes bacterium]|nr:tetratricopeptide repeat protein [Planctomycetota bacterium]
RSDYAPAHRILGSLLAGQKEYSRARNELQEALRLDPDDVWALSVLARLYAISGRLDEAIVHSEKAAILAPMNATTHADLGLAYANNRNRDKAMLALKEAQRLADPDGDVNVEQTICQAYHRLDEIPWAVEHYEKFVTLARKQGLNPEGIIWGEEKAQRLKATLTPTFIEAQMPKVYTEQTLQAALREKLTKEELQMVINPVASSPEIGRWARQLTRGAGSEFDKAKAIFDGLMQRIQPGAGFGSRTAQEVCAAWKDPNESFNCQQYTHLYLALAREVGVKAFLVNVVRDYQGKLVFHVCAIVFVEGKALLVDSTYHWFGVAHQEFVVFDDVQMVAVYLSQITSQFTPSEQLVSRCRLAVKLSPDSSYTQVRLAETLWEADRREEAKEALEAAARLEPGSWYIFRMEGRMAVDDEDWESAVTHLQKALELNPDDAGSHFLLGATLSGQGKRAEALNEYRTCLRNGARDSTADRARRAIVQINEILGNEPAQEHETAALMVAAGGGHIETVRRLLAQGTDVNAQETSGRTALMVAAQNAHADIVKLLLEAKANVNIRENIEG